MAADFEKTFNPKDFNADLPPQELPIDTVSRLSNIVSDDGVLRQAAPFQGIFGTTLFKPRWLLANQDNTNAYWCYPSDQAIGVTDGVNHFDISPAGLGDASALTAPWTGGVINQLPVINSLLDGPYWWDQNTAAVMTLLPDWPASDLCQSMRPFREFLIAMNIFTGGTRLGDLVRWSDAAAPGDIPRSWTPSTNSQAGERSVSFNSGQLVDGFQLLDRFYMYKTSSTYVLQLIGGAFIFAQKPVFNTVGLLARNCLIEWRGQHILLTDGDLVAHDGVTVRSLVDKKQRKAIFGDLDGTNFENSFIALSRATNELLICFPRVGEIYPSDALVLSLEDLRFGHQKLNPTGTPYVTEGLVDVSDTDFETDWNQRTTLWSNDPTRWNSAGFARTSDFFVIADYENLQLEQIGAGNTQNGVPIDGVIERTAISFDDPTLRKYGGKVWPVIDGASGGEVFLQLGAHDIAGTAPVYAAEQSFIIGVDQFLDFDVQGYYLAYRIRSTDQLTWKLTSFKLEANVLGKF